MLLTTRPVQDGPRGRHTSAPQPLVPCHRYPPHPAALEKLGRSGARPSHVLTKLSPQPLSGHST